MYWKSVFKKGWELVLSTCSVQGEPNANIVISLGFHDDKLLVADAQICVVAKRDGLYCRIKDTVEIFNSGKYLDICKSADKKILPEMQF